MYYYLAITATTVCTTKSFDEVSNAYCAGYNNITGPGSKEEKYYYFYAYLVNPSIICFGLLFVETSINLTYYKDCVFAAAVLMMYLGMFWVNRGQKGLDKHGPYTRIIGGVIRSDMDLVESDADKICNWLIALIVLLFMFILVTLLTDW